MASLPFVSRLVRGTEGGGVLYPLGPALSTLVCVYVAGFYGGSSSILKPAPSNAQRLL